jgi:NAD(P)-dependent dehydrogenase (short-subunit alcohol dehydrogenase family)
MFSSPVAAKANLMQQYSRSVKIISVVSRAMFPIWQILIGCMPWWRNRRVVSIFCLQMRVLVSSIRWGKITEAQFDKIFSVNVKGLLFTVQKALPLFHDGGSVILNASIGASKGVGATFVYSASKAAIRSFARTWTVDLKYRKIRVNVVSPGPIDTPVFNSLAQTEEEIRQIKANLVAGVPMGRIGTPDEIAKAVSFLASDDSSYITGIELFVDGGMAQI